MLIYHSNILKKNDLNRNLIIKFKQYNRDFLIKKYLFKLIIKKKKNIINK